MTNVVDLLPFVLRLYQDQASLESQSSKVDAKNIIPSIINSLKTIISGGSVDLTKPIAFSEIQNEEVTRDKISADIMNCDTQSSNSEQLLMMASGKKKLSDVAETCGYLANLINLSTNAITQKATIENKENIMQLQSVTNGYKHSMKQLERIGVDLKNHNYMLMQENSVLHENYEHAVSENKNLTLRIKQLEKELQTRTQIAGGLEFTLAECKSKHAQEIESLQILNDQNVSQLQRIQQSVAELVQSVDINIDFEADPNEFLINSIQEVKSKFQCCKEKESLFLDEIKELKVEKEELLQNYEKEVMHNGLRGQQVNDTKTELEAMTDLYAGVSVQNLHLLSELDNLKNEITKIESNHKEVLEKMFDQEVEMKKRHFDAIREAKKEYQELALKLQSNQELLDATTKERENIQQEYTSILLEKERMISNSSLLEKKKIASERKLITAEKTIAALQAIINESQNNLIFLLEKLQLRESDIDEEIINNAVVLDKYHAIVQDLIKCDELEASRETLIQETNAHVKKEALEAQSQMVRQVSECTSTTISTERARNASLSIALDQAEERVEKLEKEYKEVKEKLALTEKLHLLATEQLEKKSMEGLKENHASDKEIFALQRTILELKHTVEAAKREVAVVSNERNSLRIKLQSANDQHIEEIRNISNGPWKQFINEQKKYWIKLQAAMNIEKTD